MAKSSASARRRIVVDGVSVILLPQPQKGTIPKAKIRNAVAKVLAAEKAAGKKKPK